MKYDSPSVISDSGVVIVNVVVCQWRCQWHFYVNVDSLKLWLLPGSSQSVLNMREGFSVRIIGIKFRTPFKSDDGIKIKCIFIESFINSRIRTKH